jgi:hypothetical protein
MPLAHPEQCRKPPPRVVGPIAHGRRPSCSVRDGARTSQFWLKAPPHGQRRASAAGAVIWGAERAHYLVQVSEVDDPAARSAARSLLRVLGGVEGRGCRGVG